IILFFFSSRRRHTRFSRDWSSDVCSSDLQHGDQGGEAGDGRGLPPVDAEEPGRVGGEQRDGGLGEGLDGTLEGGDPEGASEHGRSEERRVGKAWSSRIADVDV